jgi:hypothetical protein
MEIIAVVVGGVVLFIMSGLTQNLFPWAQKSVQVVEGDLGKHIAEVTTDGMVYTTQNVAAFLAVKPASYYAMGRYFAIEFATQLLVSAVLVIILSLTDDALENAEQLGLVALVALAGILSVDIQQWNWWGFSSKYAFGMAFNRLLSYLIAGAILVFAF